MELNEKRIKAAIFLQMSFINEIHVYLLNGSIKSADVCILFDLKLGHSDFISILL